MVTENICERISNSSKRIQSLCEGYGTPLSAVQLERRCPDLVVADNSWSLPANTWSTLDQSHRAAILKIMRQRIQQTRDRMLSTFHQFSQQLVSSKGSAGVHDHAIESALHKLFEGRFSHFQAQVRDTVATKSAIYRSGSQNRTDNRESSTFSMHAISVLEKAFSNSEVSTTLECQMVAKAAGITHQQVRTWFQNKRNRGGRKNRRIASTSSLSDRVTEPVAPPRRVISGLPARAKLPVVTDENTHSPLPGAQGSTVHPGGAIRTIRGSPKRKSSVPASSPSDSLSSLGSISPAGGFQSPFESVGGETNVSVRVVPREHAQGWVNAKETDTPFDIGQLVSHLQVPAYCDYGAESGLAASTLAKTPSNMSIQSDRAHNPLEVTYAGDDSAPGNEGEEDILALSGQSLTGVGAGNDYDFFTETLDVSNLVPSFTTDLDDPHPIAPNELDELNAFFDSRTMEEEEEETRVTVQDVESDQSSTEGGRTIPGEPRASEGSTEVLSPSHSQDIPAIAVTDDTIPTPDEVPTVETEPPMEALYIAPSVPQPSEVSSEPDFDRLPIPHLVPRPPASVVSDSTHTHFETESFQLYEDSALVEPPPVISDAYQPYVTDTQTHEFQPSYWDVPAVPAPRYYQPHPAPHGYRSQSTPFQPFGPSEPEPLHWTPGVSPFDNPDAYLPPDVPYYEQTRQQHIYPMPMVEPQEWVMVPRSSVAASYSAPHVVPQPHGWHV